MNRSESPSLSKFSIRAHHHFSLNCSPLIGPLMPEVEVELKTAPVDFRFPTTNQIRLVSYATLSFTGAWQQKVKSLVHVRNLPRIIVPFAQVTGLRGGMSRGKPGLSLGLFDVTSVPWTILL